MADNQQYYRLYVIKTSTPGHTVICLLLDIEQMKQTQTQPAHIPAFDRQSRTSDCPKHKTSILNEILFLYDHFYFSLLTSYFPLPTSHFHFYPQLDRLRSQPFKWDQASRALTADRSALLALLVLTPTA